jgi:hypothetical protein
VASSVIHQHLLLSRIAMKQLEEYYLSLKIQSVAQGVSEPLDPSYVPNPNEEKQLFHLKQDSLFGVFVDTMKVSQLHSVVKKHTNDLDGPCCIA